MKRLLLYIVLCEFVMLCQPARILVLSPMGTRSHLYGFMPMVEALAEKGHQLTVVSPHSPKTESPNIHKIVLSEVVDFLDEAWYSFKSPGLIESFVTPLWEFRRAAMRGYAPFMAIEEIQTFIRTKAVDLVILDAILNDLALPFIDHLGVPFIYHSPGAGATWTWAALGVDQQFSTVPSIAMEAKSTLSFYERMMNMLLSKLFLLAREVWVLGAVDQLAKQDFPHARPVRDIERDAALCLINIDSATSRPRSLPPTVVPVGAMHCHPPKRLPKELETFADGATDGFIVFTLGSNAQVSLMPENIKQMFVRVFARLPQRVIWKWEKESLLVDSVTPNVKIVDWLPQQDLLGHRNARLFISHGGLLGTQEAIYHRVPILGLPLGRDQRGVLSKCVEEGAAIKYEWEELTEDVLYDSIKNLVEQPSFKGNVSRLSGLMRDEMMPAKDVAAFWVEYVLRHNGTRHLQSVAKDMPFYQYYLLDVWLFLLLLLYSMIHIGVKTTCWIHKKLMPNNKTKTS